MSWSWLLAAVILAGCLSPPTNDPLRDTVSTGATTSSETISGPTHPPTENLTFIPSATQWNDCAWLGTAFTYALDTGPAQPPDGWGGSQGWGYDIFMDFLSCKRIAWGHFERPVNVILEYHSNVDPPEDCLEGDWTHFAVMNMVYVDDVDFGFWLNETYQLPVTRAEINYTLDHGTLGAMTWKLTPAGGQTSTISSFGVEDRSLPIHAPVMRFFWEAGNGITMMHAEMELEGPLPLAVSPGEMHEPTLYSSTFTTFPGRGQYGILELTGTIQRFGDHLCKEPLES